MSNSTSKQQSPKVQITLSIIGSKCTHFSFTEHGLLNKKEISSDGYEFEFSLNFRTKVKDKRTEVVVRTKLFEKETQDIKLQIAELDAEFDFKIENFDELVIKKSDKEMSVKNVLINICFTLALNTLRGMYNIKLENSLYENAIFPLVDVAKVAAANKPS